MQNLINKTPLAMIGLAAALFFLPNAEAAKSSDKHSISVGGGVASPSSTSALGENPAGLIYNDRFKAMFAASTGSRDLNPIGYGGFIFTGNEAFGGGLALQGFNAHSGSPGNILLFNYGGAVYFKGLDISFGLTGTRTITEGGTPSGTGVGTTWCVDAGLIFNPHGRSRWGVGIFQLLNDVDAVTVGHARDLNHSTTVVADLSYNYKTSSSILKPGIEVHMNPLQFSVSYGIDVVGNGWAWFSTGLSAGFGFNIGKNVLLQAYINQIAEYFVSTTLQL